LRELSARLELALDGDLIDGSPEGITLVEVDTRQLTRHIRSRERCAAWL
jgi:hypothetical protein